MEGAARFWPLLLAAVLLLLLWFAVLPCALNYLALGRKKEGYGEPPGNLRAVHRDELGYRGWADAPGSYEGSSASAVSAFAMRSA